MKSPGELLKHARLEKGLSLSEAAAMTRISRTMLKHLEQDRFDEFNAEVFVRGHLRNYAREVGADPEKVVHAYERLGAKPASNQRRTADSNSKRSRNRAISKPPKSTRKTARPRAKATQAKPNASKTNQIQANLANWSERIGPTHMVAVLLVLVGFVLFVSLLSGNRATAQDPAQFPTKSQDAWELERDVEQTRWLLEQPGSDDSAQQ